ncbi:unnamed protein product, partial [Ectocarpus sp. 12 AP-2014]
HVTAAGGFVLGRNGISYQWQAQSVDSTGRTRTIRVDPERVTLMSSSEDRAIKTQGTNMAVRRKWLVERGGFDPGFHYFLDETDVNLRLANEGCLTAIVPQALVHHGFAANSTRTAARVPVDLYEIGASWTVFLDKHCAPDLRTRILKRVRRNERRRVLRHMVSGALEPRDVRHLLKRFDEGCDAGRARGHRRMAMLPGPDDPYRRYPVKLEAPSLVVSGRLWQRSKLHALARHERQAGRVVTEIILSWTALRHKVRYG